MTNKRALGKTRRHKRFIACSFLCLAVSVWAYPVAMLQRDPFWFASTQVLIWVYGLVDRSTDSAMYCTARDRISRDPIRNLHNIARLVEASMPTDVSEGIVTPIRWVRGEPVPLYVSPELVFKGEPGMGWSTCSLYLNATPSLVRASQSVSSNASQGEPAYGRFCDHVQFLDMQESQYARRPWTAVISVHSGSKKVDVSRVVSGTFSLVPPVWCESYESLLPSTPSSTNTNIRDVLEFSVLGDAILCKRIESPELEGVALGLDVSIVRDNKCVAKTEGYVPLRTPQNGECLPLTVFDELALTKWNGDAPDLWAIRVAYADRWSALGADRGAITAWRGNFEIVSKERNRLLGQLAKSVKTGAFAK